MARSTQHEWLSIRRFVSRRRDPRRRRPSGTQPFERRLRIEPLEDRRLLSITVNTLVDELDGSIVDGDISLRDAIAVAPLGEAINFAVTGTINLTMGEISINRGLTVNGPGANLLTIDASGNDPTPDENNGDGSRVFNIGDGIFGTEANVLISGLTLTGGDASSGGGAIMSTENLTLAGSTVNGNSAYYGGGGGIENFYGYLTVTSSTINGNSAYNGGGGIRNDNGHLTVISSTISGNSASEGGGGIENFYGHLTATSSTISGNSADNGGGVYSETNNATNTTITDSTLSDNTAWGVGGGLYNYYGLTLIQYSTITGNRALFGGGSGVASYGYSYARTNVRSSIIAGNVHSDVDFVVGDTNSFTSFGYNLIGTGNALGRFQFEDQTGVINPLLGPLINNGGPTNTHALLAGSPAIDKGNPAAAAGVGTVPIYDQRGAPFGRVLNGETIPGARIDVGAFELLQIVAPAVPGDYNRDGTVDASDYILWRFALGSHVASYSGADGNGNGVVDIADYDVWKSHFGMTLPEPTAGGGDAAPTSSAVAIQIQELAALVQPSAEPTSASAKSNPTAVRAAGFVVLDTPFRGQNSGSRSRGPIGRFRVTKVGGDDLLLLAIDRAGHSPQRDFDRSHDDGNDEPRADLGNSRHLIDEPLALAPSTNLAEVFAHDAFERSYR